MKGFIKFYRKLAEEGFIFIYIFVVFWNVKDNFIGVRLKI